VGEHGADEGAVEGVLAASRALIAVATRSLGAAAAETTIAQCRALEVLGTAGRRQPHLPGASRTVAAPDEAASLTRLAHEIPGQRPDAQATRDSATMQTFHLPV